MTKRSRTPEKDEEYKHHYIYEGDDEYDAIDDLLRADNAEAKRGDHIHYMPNNQMGAKSTRIIRDRHGNKVIAPWKYLYEDNLGGLVKRKGTKRKGTKRKGTKRKGTKRKGTKRKGRKSKNARK